MNELKIFNYKNNEVRTTIKDSAQRRSGTRELATLDCFPRWVQMLVPNLKKKTNGYHE